MMKKIFVVFMLMVFCVTGFAKKFDHNILDKISVEADSEEQIPDNEFCSENDSEEIYNYQEELDPYYKSLDAYLQLCEIAREQKNYEKLRKHLTDTGNLLTEMYLVAKDEEIKKSFSAHREDVIFDIAESWFAEEKGDKATEVLENAIKNNMFTSNKIMDVYLRLSSWYKAKGDLQKAEEILMQSIKYNQPNLKAK